MRSIIDAGVTRPADGAVCPNENVWLMNAVVALNGPVRVVFVCNEHVNKTESSEFFLEGGNELSDRRRTSGHGGNVSGRQCRHVHDAEGEQNEVAHGKEP
jgi:hypothetical protein